MALLVLTAAVLVSGPRPPAASQQQPPRGQARPGAAEQTAGRQPVGAMQRGTARVAGRVLLPDGRPAHRALALLRSGSGEGQTGRGTETDANGRFEFTRLPAGDYQLTATRAYYTTAVYPDARPNSRFALAEGQDLADIDLMLRRGCVVTGRVLDEFGDPVVGARVLALQRVQSATGGAELSVTGGTIEGTDDLGEYRIASLQPGDYYVAAGPSAGAPGSAGFQVKGSLPDLLTTYYPGTASSAEAQRVTCEAGQEAAGIDITLIPGRLYRVTGRLIDSTGQPVAGGSIAIIPVDGVLVATGRGTVERGGAFTIRDVAPGQYRLSAVSQPATTAGGPATRESASILLGVADDTDGVIVQTARPGSISGRVVIDRGSTTNAPMQNVRVRAVAADPTSGRNEGAATSVRPDGSFLLAGVIGPVVLGASAPNWTLKSVRVGGQDQTDVPFEIRGGEDVVDAEIVLTNTRTLVAGQVTTDRGAPARGATVVLFSDDPAHWVPWSRMFATVLVSSDGTFRSPTLPPGDYLAVALDDRQAGPQAGHVEALEALKPQATRFRLTEGETETVALRVRTVKQ